MKYFCIFFLFLCGCVSSPDPMDLQRAEDMESKIYDNLQILVYGAMRQQNPELANCLLEGALEILGEPDDREKAYAAVIDKDSCKVLIQDTRTMVSERNALRKSSKKITKNYFHYRESHRVLNWLMGIFFCSVLVIIFLFI